MLQKKKKNVAAVGGFRNSVAIIKRWGILRLRHKTPQRAGPYYRYSHLRMTMRVYLLITRPVHTIGFEGTHFGAYSMYTSVASVLQLIDLD